MYLIYNPDSREFFIVPTIEGKVFNKKDKIEVHGDSKRGLVYKKDKNKDMASTLTEQKILDRVGVIVE